MLASKTRPSRGFSLAEALVAMTLASVLLMGLLHFFEAAAADTRRKTRQIEDRRVHQVTVDHVVRTLRQVRTGPVVNNPANCLACHADVDGEFSDNPETNCLEDMAAPIPPVTLDLFDVDPSDPSDEVDVGEYPWNGGTSSEEVRGLRFVADIMAPPADWTGNDSIQEERSFYALDDLHGEGWMVIESADHDRDGVDDEFFDVAHGVRDLRFSLEFKPPPVWDTGDSVSNNCIGCHESITGGGEWVGESTDGEVWWGQHPDSQSIMAIRVKVGTGIELEVDPVTGEASELVLESLVRPRGLDL
ncbi:MAG: prepilin-type N-terminal cleavage/methylation domain-containing protein [Acidobacteriota bacterium]